MAVARVYKFLFEYRERGLYLVAAERVDELEAIVLDADTRQKATNHSHALKPRGLLGLSLSLHRTPYTRL
ncbi:hypothetical protein LC612_30275 [Nostoc sp. CHAB 5834]|nr:hypothetical protein [Nostoc sp. CHAB 5834]